METDQCGQNLRRSQHSSAFKARVALDALREDKSIAELCTEFDLRPVQILEWRGQLQEGAPGIFDAIEAKRPKKLSAGAQALLLLVGGDPSQVKLGRKP